MIEINYSAAISFITAVWLLCRICISVKNRNFNIKREILLLTVYICFIVIARIVYFPLHLVDGKIGPLIFDASKIFPPWINLVPLVHLIGEYDGWLINLIGNIAMFIPVGIFWPLCFKKLDSIAKTLLAAGGFSLFIEITQLLFYERATDIDDLLMNTFGGAVGAIIYFVIKHISDRKKGRKIKI